MNLELSIASAQAPDTYRLMQGLALLALYDASENRPPVLANVLRAALECMSKHAVTWLTPQQRVRIFCPLACVAPRPMYAHVLLGSLACVSRTSASSTCV